MTKTGHWPGARVEEPAIDFHHRLDERVRAAVGREQADGCLQLLAVGGDRLADADLAAGADERDLVLAGQLVEKRGEPRAEVVEERRDGAARIDDQRDPHRAAGARGARDLAVDAVLQQLEIGRRVRSRTGAPLPSAAVTKTRRWTRWADKALRRTAPPPGRPGRPVSRAPV